ncbi:MAG TPA: thymidine phosphorylase [Acidimicrobiales bacterium]|nr:thymidine phosphorylase [Acidimicrobiales bacterium]
MEMTELIGRKRDGGTLRPEELEWIISGYTAGRIPDYQMSAFLMAVVWRGMSPEELAAWTGAMLHSGEIMDLSSVGRPRVDKHSTGGVGDKVSIPLAPIVAACGVAVPMVSGRGLGHTGGTRDKLESIPGMRTALDPDEFKRVLEHNGMVFGGQSATIAPADRKIYALRDATGTVPSIPLISSSIMSKKLAEDISGLVLDVKVGSGAFMKNLDDARTLARTMIGIGASHSTAVVALLTDMDQPLGREVGNANEIVESIELLRGEGSGPLLELVLRLGSQMLVLGGVAPDSGAARTAMKGAIADGSALDVLRSVVADQGGDPRVVDDTSLLPRAAHTHVLGSPRSGFVSRCDALDIGTAAVRLGAGRARAEDAIDPAVGITVLAHRGDEVAEGDALARVAYNSEDQLTAALERLEAAWVISDEPPPDRPLVLDEIG